MTDIVLGAGVIGAAIALELARRGRAVTLVEKDSPGRGCSYGNMASIAVAGFLPNAGPAAWKHVPGWLLDPAGPVRVRASALRSMAPWLIAHAAAGRPARFRALTAAGSALHRHALADWRALAAEAGVAHMFSARGTLSLFSSDRELAGDAPAFAALEEHGFAFQRLTGPEARELEPTLGPAITAAALLPDNVYVADPHLLVVALVERFKALGGRVETGEAVAVERAGRVSGLRLSDGRVLEGETLTLAAGHATAALARSVGEPIPLVAERGYHTQFAAPNVVPAHALIWHARAFMITPTAGGLRVGGTVEFASPDAPPDWRRADVLLPQAREALPELDTDGGERWIGCRPGLPDTIPILSPSAKTRGLFYATGHGHLGLTQGAVTGKAMAALVAGEAPALDLSPYRVDRF